MNAVELRQTLERVVSVLASLGIRFHVTGGLASSLYGEPRMTRDVDMVVHLRSEDIPGLLQALSPDYLVSEAAAMDALKHGGVWQALDRRTLIKVDLHVGERIEGELDRSQTRQIFEGLFVPMVSKEDAILSKLIWIQAGSARSRHDVTGMLLESTEFDIDWVRCRARALGCDSILAELEAEADRLRGEHPAP